MFDIIEIAVEKGREEGIEVGIEKGRNLDSMSAAREMLMDLLIENFGIVPNSVQEGINRIGPLYNLKSLFRQVLKCSDIEQVKALLQLLQDEEGNPESRQVQ